MLNLNRQRLLTWIPRIGFGLLLLVFGEMVAWQHAHQYDAFDWMAITAIYFSIAAILLDLMVRWHIQDWMGLLLVAGIFGLIESTLISGGLFDNLPVSLVFYATGLETVMFMLAFGAFLYLSMARPPSVYLVGLAAIVGLGWGIWVRWYPELDSVNVPEFSLDEALPLTVIALLGNLLVLFILPPPNKMSDQDWLLEPYEWAATGGILAITFVLRLADGALPAFGMSLAITVIAMILLILWFSRKGHKENLLRLLNPPKQALLYGWLFMLGAFMFMGWLGYHLPHENDDSIPATILFAILAFFGAIWLPLVSVMIGIRAFTQLARDEY